MRAPTDDEIEERARVLCQDAGVDPDVVPLVLRDDGMIVVGQTLWRDYAWAAEIDLSLVAGFCVDEGCPHHGTYHVCNS